MSRLLVPAVSLVLLAACGGSPGGTGGGGAGTGGAGTGGTGTGGAGGSTPVQACSDIGAPDCFSNLDCPAADRCENKGSPDLAVPCCVPGARGTGALDAPCQVDNDCATSLCVETSAGFRCSGECTTDGDCPASMPACTSIPAILGQGSFCLPA
jgi:hypothetical protein